MKKLLLKGFKYFLPLLFITYLSSITFFVHVHVINGVTVVHSHPFKDGAKHTHSTIELFTIHSISHFISEKVLSFSSGIAVLTFLISVFLILRKEQLNYASSQEVVTLRGPPSMA